MRLCSMLPSGILFGTYSWFDKRWWRASRISGCPNVVSPYTDEGKIYNDGEWHHMLIQRIDNNAFMEMDYEHIGNQHMW